MQQTALSEPAGKHVGLLASLNLFGLSYLEPVILAALMDERPMLLIGPPGTAKSELLNRIAQALWLRHRHYNASLIQIDDLIGFPVPDREGDGLRYLHTPNDLWDAESVFLDEISRARPEVQNRLYAILHERRVQGIRLEHLRYRWSAMNPPMPLEDPEPVQDPVEALLPRTPVLATHSAPLDPALADRFAWIVSLPDALDLSPEARRQLLERGDETPSDVTALQQALTRARAAMKRVPDETRAFALAWTETLLVNLNLVGVWISPRRAVTLCRSVLSLIAAFDALGREADPEQAAWLALHHGLPHPAWGMRPPADVLEGVHREAVKVASQSLHPSLRALVNETDNVKRLLLALETPSRLMDRQALSRILQEVWAGFDSIVDRYLFAWAIAPMLARIDRFTVHACEVLGEPLQRVLEFTLDHRPVPRPSTPEAQRCLEAIEAEVHRLHEEGVAEAESLGNLLLVLLETDIHFSPQEATSQALAWRRQFEAHAGRVAE